MEIENTNFFNSPQFTDIKILIKFMNYSTTDQCNFWAGVLKNDIKLVGKDTVYYYNIKTKLWDISNLVAYESFLYNFFNVVAKELIKVKRIIREENENLARQIGEQIKDFDKTVYVNNMIKRTSGILQNDSFVTLLDYKKDFMAIKNLKKINLRTLEVTDRQKEDYFTFFSDVEFTETTPNAERFFKEIMPKNYN